ncbi:hypothetical protein KCTC32420_01430 [Aequorivita nionensis]|jgi:hypothetical protein
MWFPFFVIERTNPFNNFQITLPRNPLNYNPLTLHLETYSQILNLIFL